MSALLAGLGAAAPCPGQCQYEVTIIQAEECPPYGYPPTKGLGLNEAGHVVGSYPFYVIGFDVPFLWTPETGMIDLPLPPGSYEASCGDINDAGQITGSMTIADVGYRGFVFEDGEYTVLPPVIPDAGWSTALAINKQGTVVGDRSIDDGVNPRNAFIWSANEGFLDLGLMDRPFTTATDISDTGIVVGWRGIQAPGEQEGFRWQNGELTFLGPIPGGISSMPHDVNDRGHIVGNSATEVARSGELRGLAFLWREGVWTILEPIDGGDQSGAAAVNNLCQVVGASGPVEADYSHATLWQHRQPYDLNTLALVDRGF